MKRLFFTHILSPENIAKHKLSFAACNFSSNLISGGMFDMVISTLPVFVTGPAPDESGKNHKLVYSSLRHKGHKAAKLATLAEQFTVFRMTPKNASVWLYNLGYLNFLYFILIRIFKPSVKLNVIELDFVPPKRKISPENLFLWLQNKADGMIKLATSPLFTCKNSCCMAGVTPGAFNENPKIKHTEKSFLISGALYEYISNLPMLLDVFSKLPDCTLHISGSGFDENIIQQYTSRYPNIIYHGVLDFNDYIALLHKVTFQLSTRQPDYPDNKCNFPSKIIEALLHNRIVISTIKYSQLNGIKYFKVGDTPDQFLNDIQIILALDESELIHYANQADTIHNQFNPDKWANAMCEIEKNSINKKH